MTAILAVVLAVISPQADQAATCAALRAPTRPGVTVTNATFREAEPAPSASTRTPAVAAAALPRHCRVRATLQPSPDSHIEMELWLPERWNGKFQMVGNGGWAGSISYPAMTQALEEGYATASTDTGHTAGLGTFAIGHPETLTDFAYRAVHATTLESKALIATYYTRPARLSYFNGCSLGGRQALMEAQAFPADFDGIIAGAPATPTARLHAWDVATSLTAVRNPDAIVPPAKLALVNKMVLAACDARDGVTDGVLADPRTCHVDITTLQCRAGDGADCLTAAQVASVQRGYAPVKTSRGEVVFPGKEPGSETGWTAFLSGQVPAVPLGSFLIAHEDATWDPRTFDLDRDLMLVEEKVGREVDATKVDLRAFKARGGKLILYHGWSDVLISPGNTIDYYSRVAQAMGGPQDDWMRLFMVPGMGHCSGGPGTDQVNWMAALERWRESGSAPATIDAARVTNGRVSTTRPLCPYGQIAAYSGVGSTNDARNFSCVADRLAP